MPASASLAPVMWQEPITPALLAGTPFNCLVVDPAAKPPQQAAVLQARQAGLEVVTLDAAPAEVLDACPWPRVESGGQDGAGAGPTGLPWIESNGWRVRLARAKTPGGNIWVRCGKLPENTALPLSPESYALAVADAAAHGGIWIVELDGELRRRMAAGQPRAVETWRQLVTAAAFFARHEAWAAMPPQGMLGVVSDFAGGNEFLAGELLNLLARRQVGYRVILSRQASLAATQGLSALLYAAQSAPAGEVLDLLISFARAGGLVILPAAAVACIPPGTDEPDAQAGFQVRAVGQGRFAVARQNWDDPYTVARDVHVLMSRRHDHLHLYNASSINSYSTVAAGGDGVVHLLNYSLRPPASPVTLAVRRRYREARFWSLGANAPTDVKMLAEADWLEMPLPPFSVYAAVELKA